MQIELGKSYRTDDSRKLRTAGLSGGDVFEFLAIFQEGDWVYVASNGKYFGPVSSGCIVAEWGVNTEKREIDED